MTEAAGVRRGLIRSAARLSRALHGRGVLGGNSSGLVRLSARRFANEGSYTYRDYHGHLVEADLTDYCERIGFFGAHSARLLRHISSSLRSGDWAIDVGANVGLFTSAMCAAVGPEGCVWAVEPLPRNLERLRALKEDNGLGQLHILPLALSSSASTARLRLPAEAGGSAFGSFVATWATSGSIEVETCRLDDLVEARHPGKPLRLLKLDVEGFEEQVLAGATDTLARSRPIVACEFHDQLLREAGTSAEGLLERFQSLGYQPQAPFGRPLGRLDGMVVDMVMVPSVTGRPGGDMQRR